ncbi:uncharacterized protein stmnd1 [Gouania willdenowi]|uniref:uncharacterized protein stmnd1 n=1 Tax=Gouania willdenowi TaxID=441366 RepID=UPI00105653DB|nr:uncharacterized protein LOC114472474 [Gouania willdenowi]
MGCSLSKKTPLEVIHGPAEETEEQEEAADKHGGRGDSAVSKGTSDSGVVMDNKECMLPGVVPFQLPPLISESVGKRQATQTGLKQGGSPAQERLKSSEILEELLNEGIIPGQSTSGEATGIMLNNSEESRRRPPARLESLSTKNTQSVLNRDEIDQKMRQAESRGDELKTQVESSVARRPAPPAPPAPAAEEEDDDAFLTPVELLQSTLPADAGPALQLHINAIREVAEGEGSTRVIDESECRPDSGGAEETTGREQQWMRRGGGSEGEERGSQSVVKEDDEVTKVEELMVGQLVTALEELENDSSFQHGEEQEGTF